MAAVGPDALKEAKPDVSSVQYAANWKAVNDSPTYVFIEAGAPAFDKEGPILYFNKFDLTNLEKHAQGERPLEAGEFDTIPLLTHELSHARDYVEKLLPEDKGRPVDERLKNTLRTELKAWAREAMSALQVWNSSKRISDAPPTPKIVAAWLEFDERILDKLDPEHDELSRRLQDYVARGLKGAMTSKQDIPDWIRDNKAFLVEEITRRAEAIRTLRDKPQ